MTRFRYFLTLPLLILGLNATMANEPLVEVLDNGIRLVVAENHVAPVAALRVYVNTGSIHEAEYMGSGISHIFEHLVSGGTTKNRTEAEIGEILDRLGGASNAYTTRDHTAYYLTTDAGKIGTAIDLMADWMINCTFPDNEVQRELGVVMEELYKGREEPMRILHQTFAETMWQLHPARYPVIGYEPLVRKLTRDDFVNYYNRMYVPNNMVVACVGDFKAAEVMQMLRDAFGPMERRTIEPVVLPEEPPQLGQKVRFIEKEGLGAAYFNIGFHTVALQHPDLYALDVMSYVLSRGASSRLVKSLREEKRLVNSIYSYSATPSYGAGSFVVHAVAPDAQYEEALTAIFEELYRMREGLITDTELERAKQQKIADDILGSQTAEDAAAELGLNLLTTGNVAFNAYYLEGIQKVTAEDVRRVARKYLFDGNSTIVALRPETAGAVEEQQAAAREEAAPVRKLVLDNGMTVLIKRNPNVPLVNLQAVFLGGVRTEPEGKAGLSNLTASTMLRGTTSRTREEIDTLFDSIGGRLSPSSGNNSLGLACEVLAKDFDTALDVVSDILQNASFPENEFTTVHRNVLSALGRLDDDWQSQISRLFREAYFTDHPYQYTTLGTSQSVEKLTPADTKAYYNGFIVPERCVFTIFGDIDEEAAMARVKEAFGGFTRAGESMPELAPPAPPREDQRIGHATSRQISALYMGYPGTTIDNQEDYYPLIVLDSVLSGIGFPGGRLHGALRGGDKDLVYLVHAWNFFGLEPGFFGIMAASSPDKMETVEEIILNIMGEIRESPVGEEELSKAKTICVTMEHLSRQTNGEMALQSALDELYGLGYDHSRQYEEKINAVTAEDLLRVARKYLTNYVMVRTGPNQQAAAE